MSGGSRAALAGSVPGGAGFPFARASWALFVGGFVTFSLLYSVQPLLPSLAAEYRLSPATASLSLSITSGALALSMLGGAALSDRRGRKPVMVAALLASSALALLVPLASSFHALLLLRLLQGVTLAGVPAIAMAYLAEEVPPARLGLAMGLYISGNSVGGMSGRILVGLLSHAASWRGALVALGLLNLAASLWFARALPPSRGFRPSPVTPRESLAGVKECLADPALVLLYGVAALAMGSFVALYNYLAFSLMGEPYRLTQAEVSWIFLNYLVGTFSSTAIGRLADRVGRGQVLWAAIAVQAAGALLTLRVSLVVVLAGIAVFTFGFFAAHSVASSWVGRRARARKATATTLYLLSYYGGASVGGWAGGVFWSGSGWPGVVTMIGSALVLAIVLALAAARVRGPEPEGLSTTQLRSASSSISSGS